MASLLHFTIGLAAGRLAAGRRHFGASLLCAGLSMLPDADVVAFALDVPYSLPLGHRGATHSIVFALSGGLVAGAIAGLRGGRIGRWAAVITLTILSHPLLDMLTTGGLGVALWWPWSEDRVFFPARVIPVAPIGLGMLSARGLYVMLWELVPSIPLCVWALWPSRSGSDKREAGDQP